jgi:hypothetical protein
VLRRDTPKLILGNGPRKANLLRGDRTLSDLLVLLIAISLAPDFLMVLAVVMISALPIAFSLFELNNSHAEHFPRRHLQTRGGLILSPSLYGLQPLGGFLAQGRKQQFTE